MYHKVLDLIQLRVSPQRLVIYKEIVSNLLLIDVSLYDVIFDNFHDSMFEGDTVVQVADFDNLLLSNIKPAIEEFGVYIEEDMLSAEILEPLSKLLTALYGYENYPDHEELLILLTEGGSEQEILSEVVVTLTGWDKPERIMELISDVSPMLFRRLKTVSTEALEARGDVPDWNDDDVVVAKYLAKLTDLWSMPEPMAILEQGYKFGEPLSTYAYLLVSDDSPYTPDRLAKFFIMAAVMSKASVMDIPSQVGEYIQARYEERPADMLAISRALAKINLEV